jgi:hypothetical protein
MDEALLGKDDVARTRRRCRLIVLLDAAERAAITPLESRRLHAFAYLADVLSPVWNLPSFDGKILKIEGGPHYPELQEELDHLVVMGLVEVLDLRYVSRGLNGARIEGRYALSFQSPHLPSLLAAIGAEASETAYDPDDVRAHEFLVELAGALATLPNDEIDKATSVDATYLSEGPGENVIIFGDWAKFPRLANTTWRTTDRFEHFMPKGATLTQGEKLYLYASYLSRVANG